MDNNYNEPKYKVKTVEEMLDRYNLLLVEKEKIVDKLEEVKEEYSKAEAEMKTLKESDEEREFFRVIDGELLRLRVKDILFVLEAEKRERENFMVNLQRELDEKQQEIHKYESKYLKIGDPLCLPSTSSPDDPQLKVYSLYLSKRLFKRDTFEQMNIFNAKTDKSDESDE